MEKEMAKAAKLHKQMAMESSDRELLEFYNQKSKGTM